MNIKFGMDNFYTRYLKRFLNSNIVRSTDVLGEFKREDLKSLIKYLNLPNTETIFEVKRKLLTSKILVDEYDDNGDPVLDEHGNPKKKEVLRYPNLNDLFTIILSDTEITFKAKKISVETSEYIQDHIDDMRSFCNDMGWTIGDICSWIDKNYDVNNDGVIDDTDKRIIEDIICDNNTYDEETIKRADVNLDGVVDSSDLIELNNYIENNGLYFIVKSEGRENIFPNKDMLIFINQFIGDFLEDYAIRDTDGWADVIHAHKPDEETHISMKVGICKCKPNQKVTIAHDCVTNAHLVIGCCGSTLEENIIGAPIYNVVEVDLKPGEYYEYTTVEADGETILDSCYLCIQCPSDYSNISGRSNSKIFLDVGDINFDGKIDMEDYNILAQYTAVGDGADLLPWNKANWTPTDKQLAVMNCRTDTEWHREEINTDDAVLLYNYINNIGDIIDLGVTPWEINTGATYDEATNVSNLLVIEGHYRSDVNIPFSEFTTDPWVIHDKFFNYLFGMAVHKYSNSEDITYVQKLLSETIVQTPNNDNVFTLGVYDEYMQDAMKQYQSSKMNYTTGDLNMDNKLDYKDLDLMRRFVDDCADYTKVCKYLSDPVAYPLTQEEKQELDKDGDGFITEIDKRLYEVELDKTYAPALRDRADIDRNGFIEEIDYTYLENIINNGSTEIERTIKNIDGTYTTITQYCDLRNRQIPFQLGWLDVQTESILEFDVNSLGNVSEVTK